MLVAVIERFRRIGFLALPLVLTLGLMTDSQAQDSGRFLRWAVDDAVTLGSNAMPLAPAFLAAGAILIPAGKAFDLEILEQAQRGYYGTWGDYLDVANGFGERYMLIPATSLFAASLVVGDDHFQDAAFTSLESVLAAVTITAAVKQVIGRPRPEEGSGSIRIRPFSGNVSFPSGHATLAFAIVTPWVYYYPGPLTYSLFVLSASTGLARVAKNKHWPTDVLVGSAVGFLTGRWLSRRHMRAAGGPTVHPYVGLHTVGVVVRFP